MIARHRVPEAPGACRSVPVLNTEMPTMGISIAAARSAARLPALWRAGLVTFAVLASLAIASVEARAVEIQTVETPGGLTAWLVEDHTVPIVAVNFAFAGGSAQDPDGKEGLANLMAATLDEGAGELDSQAYRQRLEELAVKISFDAGRDAFYGSLRTLTPKVSSGISGMTSQRGRRRTSSWLCITPSPRQPLCIQT